MNASFAILARMRLPSPAHAVLLLAGAVLIGGLAASPLLLGFGEDPLPAATGGFGEPTCQQCHFDNALDDRAGLLSVTGIPKMYTPGARYAITIALRRHDMQVGGFQLSARFLEGGRAGQQAGTLKSDGPEARVVESSGGKIAYAQHAARGRKAEGGLASWTVQWDAPPGGGVVFHVAGNATNDDFSPLGDYVYVEKVLAVAAAQ